MPQDARQDSEQIRPTTEPGFGAHARPGTSGALALRGRPGRHGAAPQTRFRFARSRIASGTHARPAGPVPKPEAKIVADHGFPRSALTGRPYFQEAKPWVLSLPRPVLAGLGCAAALAVCLGVAGIGNLVSPGVGPGAFPVSGTEALAAADSGGQTREAGTDPASDQAKPAPEAPAGGTIEERLSAWEPRTIAPADFASLPADDAPFAFALNSPAEDAPVLGDDTLQALNDALAPFRDGGRRAGFLLMDLQTGRGLAADVDEAVYGASAIKAPFVLYMCESRMPSGEVTFNTAISEGPAADAMDGSLIADDQDSYPFMTLAENAITASDNDSYRVMRASYGDEPYAEWLASLGLESIDTQEWFPQMSVRQLAQLWLEMYHFWDTGTDEAWWLETQCQLTETSFLRAGLMSNGAYPDVVVADKAGWIAGEEPALSSITDAGIVTYNGRDYLVAAVTDAPYSESWEAAFMNLTNAVFAAREALA
ncbi:serine hydrolase [Xiamenia xianingshaonis]|uniref:Beta-lactamase class A catalytic domain-containing protein n=1 Tax=Xiamenia xianingshaonis TaxID=2682776 RepID=A0ABX0IJM9_9ACTN|nr:serine hydrolase [Xiamenia xianingshaonis]NHM14765.1 hypothetical protein [Xiamenia xianingshaonis]